MSAEELEDARKEILKQFGPDIRFADLTPKDVYVYESAPSSPPKQALALPAPSADDGPTISLGQFKGNISTRLPDPESEDVSMESPSPIRAIPLPEAGPMQSTSMEPEEGTPEYIRRQFFPNLAPNDPSVAWIEGIPDRPSTGDPGLRFDLTGTPIPPELSRTLPVHLGLHHHAEGTHAGYTLEDVFLLSRSTVPAQRAGMLGVLNSIVIKLSKHSIAELIGQESSLRKRALAVAVEAMSERGSVGVRAVELLWSSVVTWDSDSKRIDGIELKDPSDDSLDALPLEYVLKQISEDFETGALPSESLYELLVVVDRMARHSNFAAMAIIDAPKLIPNLLKRFLLLSSTADTQPNPFAIEVLITLSQSSRRNASMVADSAPALLRFIVILPDSSLYTEPLATSLLVNTLRLYRTLASYGFCSQLATTAYEQFARLTRFVLSSPSTTSQLRQAWLGLIETWMVCAVDPHNTTPDHDILWSQVVGWEWDREISDLRPLLDGDDHVTWAALWRAEAAWLEGCSVNGVKGGEAEKALAIKRLRDGFEHGVERRVVERVGQDLGTLLNSISLEDTKRLDTWEKLAQASNVLGSAIRLWLACLPPLLVGPIDLPPFFLPIPQISVVCAQLTTHPLWTAVDSSSLPRAARVYIRSLSTLLCSYLYLSKASPGVPPALWLAQASSIICRLRPGDEDQAVFILNSMSQMITGDVIQLFGWSGNFSPAGQNGLAAILPILTYSVEHVSTRISPLWASPYSIKRSDTLRLPHADDAKNNFALPLPKDWIFFPLDHLLRSGQTEVFNSLPSSWNYSETDITRATLLLAKIHRHALATYQLSAFTLSREETVFSCMKVFMLEHDQQQQTSVQDVFRDSSVTRLMEDLLEPFTLTASTSHNEVPQHTLEQVSKRFLGEGTPFYQYYTDFVALYDSISFSHPLFARLLLPPLSMRYPMDYRKFLWADFNHILRTIRVPLESVITSGLQEYLWPLEDNPEVLSAYLRSLIKGQTEGMIRFTAVHHVACNIWPDLRRADGNDERAVKLLQAVVGQGGSDAVRDVVLYRQSHDEENVVEPPRCFEGLQEVKSGRSAFAALCGREVEERLGPLLA
ncbi:hypothetical protein BDY19DRAFT_890806 [Irpex rosettiformis]|uniref:Uncharacterized protein n=1 Tax=Irpex rosettiformis TaxID=378272 RepID=A0ACB8U2R9_9APHY|nr:hypothetical protein BDY19DRAFT_890806 [Irpex rosettiformis]